MMSFLSARVKQLNMDGWRKLRSGCVCLEGTRHIKWYEIGPFFDAVENEINMDVDIKDCDVGLPVSMEWDGTDTIPAPSEHPD